MKLYTIHNITHKVRYEGWQGRSAKDVLTRFANAEPYELLGDSLVEVQDEDGNTALFKIRLVPVIEDTPQSVIDEEWRLLVRKQENRGKR